MHTKKKVDNNSTWHIFYLKTLRELLNVFSMKSCAMLDQINILTLVGYYTVYAYNETLLSTFISDLESVLFKKKIFLGRTLWHRGIDHCLGCLNPKSECLSLALPLPSGPASCQGAQDTAHDSLSAWVSATNMGDLSSFSWLAQPCRLQAVAE